MTIESTNLIELLKDCRKIKIPFYQRDYSWTTENVEKLLSDILENKSKNYFLGSIVLKNGEGKWKIIIDGQQRISTILLIYKVIWNYREFYSIDIKNKLEETYRDIKFNSANLKDGKYLLKIISSEDSSFDEEIIKTKYYENYQIIKNFIKFRPNDKEFIKELYDQLNKVILSEVIVDNDVDEHILFSQINSTGKPLSAFDLVKNYLLSIVINQVEDDEYKDDKISEMINRIGRVTNLKSNDDAVRHFIAYKNGELIKKDSNTIFNSFIELCEEQLSIKNENKSIKIFEDLYKFFFYYNYLEKKKWNNEVKFKIILDTLIESIATYAVLIITIFIANSELINEKIVMSEEQKNIIKKSLLILESYKFKREFHGTSEKTITRFIPLLANSIKNNFPDSATDIKLYFFLIYKTKDKIDVTYRMPSNIEFKNGMLETHIYIKSKKFTNLFLYRLADFISKDNPWPNNLSIEHIIPQNQKQWIENGYKEMEDKIQAKLHTIGNLTLTAYNSEVSNNIFSFKKKYFEENDNFPLNKYFIIEKINKWDTEEIEKRSENLFNICNQIWSFDNYEKEIKDNELFLSYQEPIKEKDKKARIDFIAKNSKTFEKNKSNFKKIKNLIDRYHINYIMKNLMVHNFGTEKNELEVFGIEKNGWISQSIYDFLAVSNSESKGKYSEEEFENFLIKNKKYIDYMIDFIRKEL